MDSTQKTGAKILYKLFVCLWVLFSLEIGCQFAFRITSGAWLPKVIEKYNYCGVLFQQHPYLLGVPAPNVSGNFKGRTVSHNSFGSRGHEFSMQKPKGVKRIITVGGSTTYCAGLSDSESWPMVLERDLGAGYEVINLGVPGFTTVENLIQSAFWLSDLSPDLVIFYQGWNDLQNVHIKNLKPDYSDYHAKAEFDLLGLSCLKVGNRSALVYSVRKLLEKIFVIDSQDIHDIAKTVETTEDRYTDKIDARALSLYKRNLKLILALFQAQHIPAIMVPQLLNFGILTQDRPDDDRWIPYIKNKDLQAVLGVYNETMAQVAAEAHVDFASEVLHAPFGIPDFLNRGHLSHAGSEKFAQLMADRIRQKRF